MKDGVAVCKTVIVKNHDPASHIPNRNASPPVVTCAMATVLIDPEPPSPTLSQAGPITATKDITFRITAAIMVFPCSFIFFLLAKIMLTPSKPKMLI